jgi:IclR-like helix-turn-helix domain-containing protein
MARGGELDGRCRFSYELRLHRARGYGALKAILDVLAEEEPLTLTQIAQRLGRTPGSTKDYLSWLQDVDMLACQRKRYSYADPVLRLWVRIHGHPEPPHEELIAREVQAYACERLQAAEVTPMVASAPQAIEPAPPQVSQPQPPQPAQPAQPPQAALAVGAGAGAGGRGSGIIEID